MLNNFTIPKSLKKIEPRDFSGPIIPFTERPVYTSETRFRGSGGGRMRFSLVSAEIILYGDPNVAAVR